MKVIFVLIAASLLVAAGSLIAFLWAVRSGQYDDDYTPSVRILFEDEAKNETPTNPSPEDNPLTDSNEK